MSGHTLKVMLGEDTEYRLICHLDDTAKCHEVCTTHPKGHDDVTEEDCVTKFYQNGCVIAEWVNDGGIEWVGFYHELELPIAYEWDAAHEYPMLKVIPTAELTTLRAALAEAQGDIKEFVLIADDRVKDIQHLVTENRALRDEIERAVDFLEESIDFDRTYLTLGLRSILRGTQ